MIAWNSQMALDARQHLFFHDSSPLRLWRVKNSEGKQFVLKLYRVDVETDAVREGLYMESKHLSGDDEFDPSAPESGTEWAFLETTVDKFLAHYPEVEEISESQTP